MEKDILSLGIESSCDETSISVVKNGRLVLSNVINTQIDIHEIYGGVVPEIASRNHIENISAVYKAAIEEARIGHIAANYITHPTLEPPFLCLMMSGGNTQIILVKDYTHFEVLGRTKDDAVGEAFDKVARVVGLGYPGGPKIDKLAEEGEANIEIPKTHFDDLNFSFSGIKTAVINLHHKNPDINKADLAKSFEKTISDILIEHIHTAVKMTGVNTVVLAGGVSANSYIRNSFLAQRDLKIYMPDLKLCTDNGAMIAAAGYYNYLAGDVSDLSLNAIPNLKL